jgi:two-component system, NtrC family, response regulator HydG
MNSKGKILIVEDEFIVANDLRLMLQKAGYTICGIASSVVQARALIEKHSPEWILLDIILKGDYSGIDLAKELMVKKIPFLYISANTNHRTLEAAKQTQPYGFLVKPFREKDLFVMLDIARYKHQTENVRLQREAAVKADVNCLDSIIGSSLKTKELTEQIKIVAPSDTSVLINGESGTGKELVAQCIHKLSTRSNRPMVVVNCAALPLSLIETELFGHEKGAFTGATQKRTGRFEQADKGTIFLDEIGEMPPDAQVKLLRVLQEKEIERVGGESPIKVDVRIIAATNRQLEKEVAEGRFRLDLYYRLSIFPMELSPLRERKEDIPALAYHFLRKYAEKNDVPLDGISDDAMHELTAYDWPGNIRELEHVIERHVLLSTGNRIEHIDMPATTLLREHSPALSGKLKTMEEVEREHIVNALKAGNGKVSGTGGAAELLGMPAQTLYSRMKKLGIKQTFKG